MAPDHQPLGIQTLTTHVLRGLLCAAVLLTALPAGVALAGEVYGEGVTLAETTSIADLLADPDAFLGRRIRVEGRVAEVCPMAGCWMELAATGDAGPTLRIKVEDGVIVFPADARGRVAAAEGVVEAVEMSRESYVAWLAHLAEERGDEVDPASIDPGEGPFRLIRLRGLGAEIAAADPAGPADAEGSGEGE